MGDPELVEASAVTVAVPESLRWEAERRGQVFRLQTITVRLLTDDSVAAKAYGRPVDGGRGGYVSFPVPDRPELASLIASGVARAAERWTAAADHLRWTKS